MDEAIEMFARPRCPRTRRSLGEHQDESIRHSSHRDVNERKETAKHQRGRQSLSLAQNRALFDGTIDLREVRRHKLTKRQKAQVKHLRKERSSRDLAAAARKQVPTDKTPARPKKRLLPSHSGTILVPVTIGSSA